MLQTLEMIIVYIIAIGLGFVLLSAGRRYYPLFVGVGGLALVLSIYGVVSENDRPLWLWLLAVAVGAIGYFVAPHFERLSLRIAGFVLGGFMAVFLISTNGYREFHGIYEALLFIAGGGLGLLAMHYQRDELLIILSSLAGAALVTDVLEWAPALRAAAFAGLAAAGMLIQAREWILPRIPEHRLASSSNGHNEPTASP